MAAVRRSECRTTAERDVLETYRRHVRRKDATPFSAQGSALAEEVANGAIFSPEFLQRFSSCGCEDCPGTREFNEQGRIVLTPHGRTLLERAAGIGSDPNEWHYWFPGSGYVRSGCGLIRGGLANWSEAGHSRLEDLPRTGKVCGVCSDVATVATEDDRRISQ
jgi:hypothetical protein